MINEADIIMNFVSTTQITNSNEMIKNEINGISIVIHFPELTKDEQEKML